MSLLVGLLLMSASSLHAQYYELQFYHPEQEWKTIETEHFLVHYHLGAERTGKTIAKIAEEIYAPVTSLYHHEPDEKVSFVVIDYDDISNGAAYFYDNKIEIYAPSMDFELRGTHNWLRNVVTHEFTHIVQIQTSMKFGRGIPSFYLQWLGYESERRPDVLYGYPNIIASYPISGFVVPAWFAEGVAQYNRKELRYDFWDTHRDMILRSYALDGNMLTWEQMGVFGKTSLGNESSYNAGFAFVHYLSQRYGEEKLNEISRNLATLTEVTIGGAIRRAVGLDGEEVYNEWRREVASTYAARVAPIRKNLREGQPVLFVEDEDRTIENEGTGDVVFGMKAGVMQVHRHGRCCQFQETGFANLYPKFSPDGKKLAYVSAKSGDYFNQSGLYVIEFGTPNKEKAIKGGVRSDMSWSPDGTKLYYARSTRNNAHGSFYADLYEYNLEAKEEKRLTFGKRALSPSVSPDGLTLACVVGEDGTTNIATMKTDGSDFRFVTRYSQGEQVYNPEWSPDGRRILFDFSVKDGRDIGWVGPDGGDLRFLVTGPDDSRDAVFSSDGSKIIFTSDRTGVFNLYELDIESGEIAQVTNVLGGAFMPSMNRDGKLAYSAYTSAGYKLYLMHQAEVLPEGEYHYVPASNQEPSGGTLYASNGAPPSTPQFDWKTMRSYDDTQLPEVESRPYRSRYTSLSFVPFVRVDNYNPRNKAIDVIKPGVYLFSNDVLEKTGLFAGVALNARLERDLFFQFFYRGKVPLLYGLGLEPVASLELYNVTRKTDNVISLPASTIPVDISYNLLEFDVALHETFTNGILADLRYAHSRYTSVIESFVNPETSPPSLVQASSDLYLVANDLSLTLQITSLVPSRTMEINPVGRKVSLRIGREFNKFASTDSNGFRQYTITETGLTPLYDRINFTRAEVKWKEHMRLVSRNNTLTASLRAASILGPPVDDFFDFYAGGLVGMRGYPFYALGGNEIAVMGLEYRFPLIHSIDIRFMQMYFDKLYASVFANVGNAWTGKTPTLANFKKDAGVELRLESFSFYSYPTRIFLSAAYGFDRFERFVQTRNTSVTYGKEWRFYLGILFGFDLD
jgi:hypothetical protein